MAVVGCRWLGGVVGWMWVGVGGVGCRWLGVGGWVAVVAVIYITNNTDVFVYFIIQTVT